MTSPAKRSDGELWRGAGPTGRATDRVEPDASATWSSAPDAGHEALSPADLLPEDRAATGAGVRGRSASRLAQQLSERDLAVLGSLGSLRLATSQQLERLHFREGSPATQSRRCRTVMARLTDQRLVVRLERRIGGIRAGSAGFVYRLAPKGSQVLALLAGMERASTRRPEPSRHLADHTLAGTEVFVLLVEASRDRWLDLLRYEPEPDCWRHYLGGGGQRVVLRPDGLVVTAEPDGATEHWWFVEVDLGTEAPTTIRKKIAAYQAFAATGQEQAAHGVFPRVAFLTTTAQRAAVLDRAVRSVPGGEALCAVGLLEDAVAVLGPSNNNQASTPERR